ncbi:MAG: hypothetical protein M3R30_01135 [Candidatus Eremiobacteraeota bacterium]|nr:hypothetical protein [Candidatus Eremiobacteraeota bacterium]
MNVRLGLAFGLVAGLLEFGVRQLLATYQLVGTGDANAGYAASGVLTAGFLGVNVGVAIVQLAIFTGRPRRTVTTGAALLVMGVCMAVLGSVTFEVSLIAFTCFGLYALTAAADGRPTADAIAESCRIAVAAPGDAVLAFIVLAGAWMPASLILWLLAPGLPLLADVLVGVLVQLAVAYVAPRVAATYLKLQPGAEGS